MTIDRYDESNVDSRAINLTNQIDTVNTLVGVDFTHPSGSIRLNGFTQFTHFIATFEGTEYVYKITNFRTVNSGVCEYSYTLDFLKDYFSKNTNIKSALADSLVVKTTNSEQKNRFVKDSTLLLEETTNLTYLARFQPIPKGMYYIVFNSINTQQYTSIKPFLAENNLVIYECDQIGINHLYEFLSKPTEEHNAVKQAIQKIIYNPYASETNVRNIQKVENFVGFPYLFETGGQLQYKIWPKSDEFVSNKYEVYHNFGPGGPEIYIETLSDVPRIIDVLQSHIKNIYATSVFDIPYINIGSYTFNPNTINYTDLPPYTQYYLYSDMFGRLEIPIDSIINSAPVSEINVLFDIVGGAGCLQFGERIYRTNWSLLPSFSLPNPEAQDIKLDNAAIGLLSSLTQSAIPALINPSLGIASMVLNTGANILTTYNNTKRGVSWDGKSDSYLCTEIALYSIAANTSTTPADHGDSNGYMVQDYGKNIDFISGYKYWLDVTPQGIKGIDWYSDGVKGELNKDYIYINLTE